MLPSVRTWLRRALYALGIAAATVFAVRAWDAHRGDPLEPWHTYVPEELRAPQLDRADWAAWLAAESAVFDEVRATVTDRLPAQDRTPANRYFAASPVHPPRFAEDWNRSHVLQPDGPPLGVAVMLHGLTDAPYSLRHIARRYRERGWLAIVIRLPGHGTVPAALTEVEWEDWAAATRLAVREARRRVGEPAPLHLVGYSNGGTLALHYAVSALDDPELARPARLVLISPMIGITRFARFAGVLGWPAVFPAFARSAWLDVLPEFNPFKYNSFPIHAARQSSLFSSTLQRQVQQLGRAGRLGELPPILTFQSVLDNTVSTRAVVVALYALLPANGSELVVFDVNHAADLGPLLRPGSAELVDRLLPPAPRRFRSVVVSNAGTHSLAVTERIVEAGSTDALERGIGLQYRRDEFSLSHVALPFPPEDGLYGSEPDPADDFGLHLGAMAVRGERGALIVSTDVLTRSTSNPFFSYLLQRIDAGLDDPAPGR